MNLLLFLLILTAQPASSIDDRYPEASVVFQCRFEQSTDADYDQWPDGWTRQEGKGYPHYLRQAIVSDAPPGGGSALLMELNGGAAAAAGPWVPATASHDYVLDVLVRTEGLQHDRAATSLVAFDAKKQALGTLRSEGIATGGQWKRLRLGPISPPEKTAFLAVGLHLEPGKQADLKGSARFADIWLGQLPRLSAKIDSPRRILVQGSPLAASCEISGLQRPLALQWELLDLEGKRLAEHRVDCPAEGGDGAKRFAWGPSPPPPGYYRMAATLGGPRGTVHRREMPFVVTPGGAATTSAAPAEFGWSLPNVPGRLSLAELADIASQSGVRWLKCPLWLDPQDAKGAERLIEFFDALAARNIRLVGRIEQPPESLDLRLEKPVAVADLASRPQTWAPSLEPTLARLGPHVRYWQLGGDRDGTLSALPDSAEKFALVRSQLSKAGREINLGVVWNRKVPLPALPPEKTPWGFVVLGGPEGSNAVNPVAGRWAVIDPAALPSVEARAADLARQMVLAKAGGAEAAFLAEPFDPLRGVLTPEGEPTPLFLPWRTVALAIGGSDLLGTLPLPNGSANYVFARGEEAVLVLWNDKPVREELDLGETARAVDLWGRPRPPTAGGGVDAGPVPVLLTNLDWRLLRWQLDFALAQEQIPSILNARHANQVAMRNRFGQPVEGKVSFSGPEGWSIRPRESSFRIDASGTLRQPVEIVLPRDVPAGPHLLRADFDIAAGKNYRFSVWRKVQVGLDGIHAEISTRLNDAGELEVHQRIVNRSEQSIRFRCQVFVPDRRRMTCEVKVPAQGDDEQVHRFENGRQLLGKVLWLEAAEIGGSRVMNYRFVAADGKR